MKNLVDHINESFENVNERSFELDRYAMALYSTFFVDRHVVTKAFNAMCAAVESNPDISEEDALKLLTKMKPKSKIYIADVEMLLSAAKDAV